MNDNITPAVEAKLRTIKGYKYVALNGIQLTLVSDGVLQILNAEGGTEVNIRYAKDAIEEFLAE